MTRDAAKAAGMRRHVGTVGLFTMASRVLGLVREWLMAHFVGAGLESSAFYVAFAIPNFARRLFGEGALTSAFVPVFKSLAERDRMDAARRLARAVATMAWLMLGAFVVLGVLALSGLVSGWDSVVAAWNAAAGPWNAVPSLWPHLLPDDWPAMPATVLPMLRLLRIMLPYALFICAAAFGMGVLNALGRFAAAAFAPCLLNFVWIGTLLSVLFVPGLDLYARVRLLAWAVVAAGVLQMAFLLWCARRRGVPLVPSREGWRDDDTRLVWRNTATAIVGAGAIQINALLDQVLAMSAAPWAPSAIAYADRLMELPLALFGTAFGTVLLPRASYYIEHGETEEFRRISRKALNFVFLIACPLMIYFVIFARQGIYFLSNSAYEGAVTPMRIIMPTLLFVGITNITGIQMLVPMGKEIVVLWSEIGGAVTDIILNAILIPKMASAGAAIGTLAAEMVVLIIQYTALKNEVAPSFRAIQYHKIIAGIILASFASFWVLRLSLGSFVTLLISAVLFFAVYGGFLLVTGEPLSREMIFTLYADLMAKLRKR